jgi:predicted deacylase
VKLVQALTADDYLLAPESGIFEIAVELGEKVERGNPVGWIHFLERPDREPEPIISKSSGYLVAMRAPCLTQQGDCVAVIAEEVDPKSLL